jgi:acyl-CoA synthetase (AMP-forming)/AMP-acid ligase II
VNQFRNLIDALEAAPAEKPFVTFWIDEDERETVTFGEFRQRALSHAGVLRENGVCDGDRVVVIMPQGIPAMTPFVGAMMLGAVPAFLAYPNFKIEPSKYSSGLRGVTANLGAKVVAIDEQFPEEMLGHVSLSGGAKLLRLGENSRSSGSFSRPHIASDQLAFIQHSAGTTGLQKGVALTHTAVLRQLGYLAEALKVSAHDRIYSWLPLYHDMGLIACFMLPMVAHLHVVMQSPLAWVMSPGSMLQVISEYKCTLGWLPNFAFQFVPRRTPESRWSEYDLSLVRALINCSEPVRTASMQEFENAFASIGLKAGALQSAYALAENVFAATQSDVGADSGSRQIWGDGQEFRKNHRVITVSAETPGAVSFTSSGRLLPNHEIRIVSDSGRELDDQTVGEIYLKSDCMFQGYYNRPDLTAEAIIGGWYRTGDLGFRFDDELYVVGRKKDLLIVGGENIYPQDIEEIVAAHPAIHDGRAVAMGIYNPNLGTEDIVVVAEMKEDGEGLAQSAEIEKGIRNAVVAGLGVAVRTILLKPPQWIVKSTAGKPARSATREKVMKEHPEFNGQP